jgi:hypothetical protein
MNYAEDRLDRKSSENGGKDLQDCLEEAHAMLRGLAKESDVDAKDIVADKEDDADDQYDSSEKSNHGDGDGRRIKAWERKAEGNSLAGRTLRDMGQCRQAVYHCAVAWWFRSKILRYYSRQQEQEVDVIQQQQQQQGGGDCDPDTNNDAICITKTRQDAAHRCHMAVGDYAQMADFAGFPEVGIIGLLHHRNGGDPVLLQLPPNHDSDHDPGGSASRDCGCGAAQCGSLACFTAFPSSAVAPLLHDLERFHSNWKQQSNISHDNQIVSNSTPDLPQMEPLAPEDGFMCRFWEDNAAVTRDDAKTQHELFPILLQLLLLKLLYTSAQGGPFLVLACEAVQHLRSRFKTDPRLARQLQQNYKSHWAYYVFIEYLVVGVRVKPHRRSIIPYHIPVWDVVRHVDNRMLDNRNRNVNVHNETSSSVQQEEQGVGRPPFTFTHRIIGIVNTVSTSSSSSAVSSSPSLHAVARTTMRLDPMVMSHTTHPPLFVVGDSHTLSTSWQTLLLRRTNKSRTLVPVPITGLKAWHCRSQTRFFTRYNLQVVLNERLPPSAKTIILSAGEIDCREGIGGKLLEGYYSNCDEAIENTVREYVAAVRQIVESAENPVQQVLLAPVAPHAYRSRKNGKARGRDMRRERTLLWNTVLERECQETAAVNNRGCRIFFLNYEPLLRKEDPSNPVGYVLHSDYNADFTHLNSAYLPQLEQAIEQTSCDMNLL